MEPRDRIPVVLCYLLLAGMIIAACLIEIPVPLQMIPTATAIIYIGAHYSVKNLQKMHRGEEVDFAVFI